MNKPGQSQSHLFVRASASVTNMKRSRSDVDVENNSEIMNKTLTSSAVDSSIAKLDGALLTLPQSFANLMEQTGVEAQIIIKVNPNASEKEIEKYSSQNIVIEHNTTKSPTTLLRSMLEKDVRMKIKRPSPLALQDNNDENKNPYTQGSTEGNLEMEPAKRIKVDCTAINRDFLLSVLWKLKSNGGLMSEMSKSFDQKAKQLNETFEYSLDNIQKKIISGEIQNLHSLMVNFRCLVGVYILTRGQSQRIVLPQLVKFQQSLIEASKVQANLINMLKD